MAANDATSSERARGTYEPPVVVPLGDLAEAAGLCQSGASDSGLCFNGTAAGACFAGGTAGGVSCLAGTAP